jgi:hypothetical protein
MKEETMTITAGGRLPPREPSDTIPVKLSNGCAHLPPENVRHCGAEFLAKLNEQEQP